LNDAFRVERLIQRAVSPNTLNVAEGKSALMIAAENDCYETMQVLLDHGASVTQTDKFDNIALHYAALAGHFNAVALLLDHHSPLNVVNSSQCTPLMSAAKAGHAAIIRLLLNNDAEMTWELNDNNESALTLAASTGCPETVELILKSVPRNSRCVGALNVALRQAVKSDSKAAVQMLINHGADVNHSDEDNSEVIFEAVKRGCARMARCLKANGAQIDVFDKEGYTPLMRATKANDVEMVVTLIALGTDLGLRYLLAILCVHFKYLET
uniref:ANK_REP_REGION domain-containing protein n=1 Tax=Hydatigena taeniaeformis TaxID=6205 RepID=A0A0R3WQR2_HYDTA